jgi:hypothetical protein
MKDQKGEVKQNRQEDANNHELLSFGMFTISILLQSYHYSENILLPYTVDKVKMVAARS